MNNVRVFHNGILEAHSTVQECRKKKKTMQITETETDCCLKSDKDSEHSGKSCIHALSHQDEATQKKVEKAFPDNEKKAMEKKKAAEAAQDLFINTKVFNYHVDGRWVFGIGLIV